jgi:hypothetical protein
VKFSKEFRIEEPLIDRDCGAVNPMGGGKTVIFAKYFPTGQGPWTFMEPEDGSTLADLAEQMDRTINEEVAAASRGKQELEEWTAPVSDEATMQRKRALTKAR